MSCVWVDDGRPNVQGKPDMCQHCHMQVIKAKALPHSGVVRHCAPAHESQQDLKEL